MIEPDQNRHGSLAAPAEPAQLLRPQTGQLGTGRIAGFCGYPEHLRRTGRNPACGRDREANRPCPRSEWRTFRLGKFPPESRPPFRRYGIAREIQRRGEPRPPAHERACRTIEQLGSRRSGDAAIRNSPAIVDDEHETHGARLRGPKRRRGIIVVGHPALRRSSRRCLASQPVGRNRRWRRHGGRWWRRRRHHHRHRRWRRRSIPGRPRRDTRRRLRSLSGRRGFRGILHRKRQHQRQNRHNPFPLSG